MASGSITPIIPKGKWRHWAVFVIIAGSSVLGTSFISGLRLFQLLNLKSYDTQFTVREILRDILRESPTIPNILLVLDDQKASNSFSEPKMFWHRHYATVIRAAGKAGAKVIGLDLAFGVPVEKYEPDYDRDLADAVSTSPVPVVCAYATELKSDPKAHAIPINMVSAALGLAGFANLTSDSDDVVRRQELIETPPGSAHSLALRVAEKFAGSDAEWKNGKLVFQFHVIPIAPDGSIAINYAGPPRTFPSVSLAEFEAAAKAGYGSQLSDWVKGKIVLIGTDSLEDRRYTPLFSRFTGSLLGMSGVEIQANTISTLVDRDYLRPATQWVLALVFILFAGGTAWRVAALPVNRAVLFIVIEVAAIVLCSHLLFEMGYLLSGSQLLIGTLVCLIGSMGYRSHVLAPKSLSTGQSTRTGRRVTEFPENSTVVEPVTVHVLFMDVVKSTQLSADAQHRTNVRLREVVANTREFQAARKSGELISLPTGDGMALVFRHKLEGPLKCAIEIARILHSEPFCKLRMGIHSGVVFLQRDINDNLNVTGPGINIAERVMSCGEEGHILVSGEAAEQLRHLSAWSSQLIYSGEYMAKRDRVRVWNFLDGDIGSSAPLGVPSSK